MHTSFKHYIPFFEEKLHAIDVKSLAIAPYCKRYLKHILQNSKYYLQIYAAVLEKVKKEAAMPFIEMCLLDYGAGNGLLGLFAKYCGFEKVIVNDIDESFLTASTVLVTEVTPTDENSVSNKTNPITKCKNDPAPKTIKR